jgi:hypothetical protein
MAKKNEVKIYDSLGLNLINGWNEDRPRQIYELALLGHNEARMARVMGISVSLLNTWKHEKPEFMQALEAGKDWADAQVVKALHKCAVGYRYKEQVAHTFEGVTTVTSLKRYKGPDAWAAAKWLSLRQRESGWSESAKIEVNTQININKVDFTGMTDEILLTIRDAQRKHLNEDAGGH